ncbi:MAG: DUF2802 domain-containing protein, partial [Gammaproteobacteria bacterium]
RARTGSAYRRNSLMTLTLIAAAAAVFVLTAWNAWLTFAYLKLKREIRFLNARVEGHNSDIAGLCSAAVTVDSRLTGADDLLKNLAAKLSEAETGEAAEQSYQHVLESVRQGADEAELMQRFDISRDEAALLIRLHGAQSKCI